MTGAKVRVRLSAEDALEEAVETLKVLMRHGKDRERYLASIKLIELATEDSEQEITLCAVSPEVITLEAIRAEAEKRRQAALTGLTSDNIQLSDTRKPSLIEVLERLEPTDDPD